jgi:hypothetical protein
MHTSVHVAVDGAVIVGQGIDDGLWFLGGGGIIQVNQWFAVYLLLQGGKVISDPVNVETQRLRV